MIPMMGRQSDGQEPLFYSFSLEDHVPSNHLLRGVDHFLDLSDLRRHLEAFYSSTGRPSIDPELMIRMLIIGYCFGIRSERRLCEEVHLNLAYRWFCRLSLSDKVPDHSTFSKNRHGRFRDSDAFRRLFEQVLERCMAEGLVGGEGFAVDASVIKADASRHRHREDDDDWGGGRGRRAVREYLDALDVADTTRKISLTDPAASYTAFPSGGAFYAYSTNYLIDTDHGIIVDVEPSTANRSHEVATTKTMVERVANRFNLKPQRLIGDTAYGTSAMLGWMVEEQGIEPHVPVWDKTERKDGCFSRSDFTWDAQLQEYRCPAGKPLRSRQRHYKQRDSLVTTENTILHFARKHDCDPCPMKSRCCPNMPARKIARSIHEDARDVARDIAKTDAYLRSRKERKKVEMLFAHLKRILKLDRLRLRGLSGARDEFLLAATAQNLRRMAKWLMPRVAEVNQIPA